MLFLAPGPVTVPDFVIQAFSKSVISHRSAEFQKLFAEIQTGLKYLFQTQSPVITLNCTGSMACEIAIRNLFQAGDSLLVFDFGKFSQRWLDFAQNQGYNCEAIQADWGKTITLEAFKTVVKNTHKGIIFTHCETSTGCMIDLEEMAFYAKQQNPNVILFVDAISTVGAIPYYHDAWGIDASVVSSPKSLMCPAGLGMIALSPLAIQQLKPAHSSDTFALHNYLVALEKNSFPYTAPVQMLFALQASLDWLQKITLPTRWNWVRAASKQTKQAIQELTGHVFGEFPCDNITAFYFDDLDPTHFKQQLTSNGLQISGGQDQLLGKILRIGHLACSQELEYLQALTILAKTCTEIRSNPSATSVID